MTGAVRRVEQLQLQNQKNQDTNDESHKYIRKLELKLQQETLNC